MNFSLRRGALLSTSVSPESAVEASRCSSLCGFECREDIALRVLDTAHAYLHARLGEWRPGAGSSGRHEPLGVRAGAACQEPRGEGPARAPPEAAAARGVGVTDPDSRVVRDYHGYFQGYNVQAVTTRDQIIVALGSCC